MILMHGVISLPDASSYDKSVFIGLAHAGFYKLYPIIVAFPCHIFIYLTTKET